MGLTSETGNAKQLAGFEDFIAQITALGTLYNPPKPELRILNLQEKLTEAKIAMRDISIAMPPFSLAVDKQVLVFKSLNNKITRSLNYFKVCISNPKEIETAKSLADKIRGFQRKKKVPVSANKPANKSISQSRMSYDNRIENLKQYIDVLALSNVYLNPGNDIELDDLRIILNQMEDTNRTVAITKLPLEVVRKKRDIIFYAPVEGIADLVLSVKSYLKATLQKSNPFYNALMGFTFKKRA
ncbi:hypothetical protein [Pedobacter mendelii]|uniref:Uncharacterized protein n=1 Tax=Pedobacter mendelii TaxID=1908240 RepID=A0ABQ2BF83_9SPHI|nr:hypothetical protein [Pedobacter mendelii]GGI24687.1 hypothetical protein GCM10008119_13900 [Pedobacter mendelii]